MTEDLHLLCHYESLERHSNSPEHLPRPRLFVCLGAASLNVRDVTLVRFRHSINNQFDWPIVKYANR